MQIEPIQDLLGVYRAFQGKPLSDDNFASWYVDSDQARGKAEVNRIVRRLQAIPEASLQMIFAGYRGCGKSTELVRLKREVEADFFVLTLSVYNELNPVSLNYLEIFILAMEKLFDFVVRNRVVLSPEYLENIRQWLYTKELTQVRDKYLGGEFSAGAGVEVGAPFLARFFAKFSASAKTSQSFKETLKRDVEPRAMELIQSCNDLLREIQLQLAKIDKKGLVLIFEDMDKLDLLKAEELFYTHAVHLTSLRTHCIFTFPIALVYHPRFTGIQGNFDVYFELPMIKVYEQTGEIFEAGIAIMRDIVSRRMNLTLFESEEALYRLITYSGGCMRDLFRLIVSAADNVLDKGRTKIGMDDMWSAFYSLKSDYQNTISEKTRDGEVLITVDQYYAALEELANDPHKQPDNTETMMDLRQSLCVLGYNGKNWCDVHPVVKEILKDRKQA